MTEQTVEAFAFALIALAAITFAGLAAVGMMARWFSPKRLRGALLLLAAAAFLIVMVALDRHADYVNCLGEKQMSKHDVKC